MKLRSFEIHRILETEKRGGVVHELDGVGFAFKRYRELIEVDKEEYEQENGRILTFDELYPKPVKVPLWKRVFARS